MQIIRKIPTGVYGERAKQIMETLSKFVRPLVKKADNIKHHSDWHCMRPAIEEGAKMIVEDARFKITQYDAAGNEAGAPVEKYTDRKMQLNEVGREQLESMYRDDAQRIDTYIGRSGRDFGQIAVFYSFEKGTPDHHSDTLFHKGRDYFREWADVMQMICYVIMNKISPLAEKIHIETTTDTVELMMQTGEQKKLNTEVKTLDISVSELKAFSDFTKFLFPASKNRPQKKATAEFIEKHGQAAWDTLLGEPVTEEPFKLASYDIIDSAYYEAAMKLA